MTAQGDGAGVIRVAVDLDVKRPEGSTDHS